MPHRTVIAALLGAALLAPLARSAEPVSELPDELRDTLPGGSKLGDAPELPHASVDVLPRPTRIEIQVKRQAPPKKED
jgi:hypothetical protein